MKLKSPKRRDISFWLRIFLGILLFFFAFLEYGKLEIKKAKGETKQSEKIIILNFDDGPRPSVLKELLPLLKKYKVPAAFFMEGAIISQHLELVKKMHEDGFQIENHSWGHENFEKLFKYQGGKAAVKLSVIKTENVIFEVTGRKPRFFRPPFWIINKEIENIIATLGYTIMKLGNPDIDAFDYADYPNRPPEALITRVKKIISSREKQGQFRHVLVFHELHLTVKALKTLIPHFQSQGYKFVRLDEK